MSRSYSEKTIKVLFGRANRCAYPECNERLIFVDRGCVTVTAEIAHIRSGSVDGPRHRPGFEQVDSEENLLLLCRKHHKSVDDHESTYRVEELLDWKARQVTEGTNLDLPEDQLVQIVKQVERSLAALVEAQLTVQPGLPEPPYRPLPSGAPEVWMLQPQFGVVPYLGRDELLGDLEAWCIGRLPFSVGLITGEGGSGKSRLAAELCARMNEHGWVAGLVPKPEALAEIGS